jgi:hypothetical protein
MFELPTGVLRSSKYSQKLMMLRIYLERRGANEIAIAFSHLSSIFSLSNLFMNVELSFRNSGVSGALEDQNHLMRTISGLNPFSNNDSKDGAGPVPKCDGIANLDSDLDVSRRLK